MTSFHWALVNAFAVFLLVNSVDPQFRVRPEHVFNKGNLYYRVLLLDEDANALYVGAMNSFYKLNMNDINSTLLRDKFGEFELKPTTEALALCSVRTRDQELKCQNHVKLVIKRSDGTLYLCSTNALNPTISILDSTTLHVHETGSSGAAICPSDPDDFGAAVWIEHGNPGKIPSIYSATATDYTGANRVIYRPPLLNERGDMMHPYMSTAHTDSKWLKEPNFVAAFDVGDGYVYYFFRELAVEYMSCGTVIYSRVGRICKSDTGGRNLLKQTWTSFFKARLNCSISGEFPFYFNEIQDVYKVSGSNQETLFYATFSTGENGFSGSAICVYTLSEIKAVFDSSPFKGQVSPLHVWQALPSTETPTPRPGQCVRDSKTLSDTTLHFVKTHTLMDRAISHQNNKFRSPEGPLFYRKDVILKKLVVDIVVGEDSSYPVIYAASNNGKLFKIVSWYDAHSYVQANVVAVYKLRHEEPVHAMQILPGQYLYIAQDVEVSQIELPQCHLYKSCILCAQDPYCAWHSIRQQCHRYRTSYRDEWIKISSADPLKPSCVEVTRRFTRLLYPGDSISLTCHQKLPNNAEERLDAIWMFNNRTLDLSDSKFLLTVENGLVIVNITKDYSGLYECVQQKNKLVSYQIFVDDKNCQKPHSIQEFNAVYREWCREFQEYKLTMSRWKKWYEQNLQCSDSSDRRRLAQDHELKSNRLVQVNR
ncbi:Semaphorin-2A [Trichinella zimbabwensis]|uniref:Semaphorin-2A n=1 Tax=Trichinella zimbabwensis TaxID=268475 RepID=A0A0V1HHI2_9BILA|nr:Semaphorin-2A [Trichinella zimbabwensis]